MQPNPFFPFFRNQQNTKYGVDKKTKKKLIFLTIIFLLSIQSLYSLSNIFVNAQEIEWYGYTDHGATGVQQANEFHGRQITTGEQSRYRIMSGSAYISSTDTNNLHNAKFCIYTTTGELLAVSEPTAYSSLEGWVIFTFSANYYLNATTDYIMGIIPDADTNMWTSNYGSKKYNNTNSYTSPINVTGFATSGSAYTQTLGLMPDSTTTDIYNVMYHIIMNTTLINHGTVSWQALYPNGSMSEVSTDTDFYLPISSYLIVYGVADSGYFFNKTVYGAVNPIYVGILYYSGQGFLIDRNYEFWCEFTEYTGEGTPVTYINVYPTSGGTGITWVSCNGEVTRITIDRNEEEPYSADTGYNFTVPFNTQIQLYWNTSFPINFEFNHWLLQYASTFQAVQSSTDNPYYYENAYGEDRTTTNDTSNKVIHSWATITEDLTPPITPPRVLYFSANIIVGLALVIIFGILGLLGAGKDGFLVGLMIAMAIASVSGLFPIWCIIFSIILGALLVLDKSGYLHS